MYLVVNTEVLFPVSPSGRAAFKFTTVSSFQVESSWKSLTTTCKIVIAKKLFMAQKLKINDMVNVGDPIILRAGYNREFNEEFSGYVSEILDDMPVELICEDEMYQLKRTDAPNGNYLNFKLEDFLKKIMPAKYKIDAADMLVSGRVVLQGHTVAQALDILKQDNIYCYFVGDTLVGGKIYEDNPNTEVVKYEFTKNVITNDLRKKKAFDTPIRVRGTHHNPDGTKVVVIVGEKGQIQELSYGESDKEKMKALAEKDLKRLQTNGYEGGLTAFGIPFVKHGYTATITNKINPDREGNFYVDGVGTSLNDMGALRRVVKLGPNAAKQLN